MRNSLRGLIVGTLALLGAVAGTVEADAMPVQPLATTAAAPSAGVDQVYYRYGYGYRRPFVRRFFYRRPFVRRFIYRRPFFGYGYRRPLFGYGYRRF